MMKKNRILVAALAISLVAILAWGTLAYFTDSDTVTNSFMTATSTDPDKKLFDVDLYETDVDGDNDVKANTYTEILPGETVTKDPTVKNTGMYNQYVRVNITVSNAAEWKAACAAHNITDLSTIFGNFNDEWERKDVKEDTVNNTLTYVFYLNRVLEPEQTSTVFETFTIPASFTIDDMNTLKTFTLTIVADAIQSDNNGANAVEGFQNWE